MYNFMIFKDGNDSEKKHYEKRIEEFVDCIAEGYVKGKRVLVITGSGISTGSVPGMQGLMDKIVKLVKDYKKSWDKSNTFREIFKDYKNADKEDAERYQRQARLLTYIQNAYMGKEKYVQKQDIIALTEIWEHFVEWLIEGDKEEGVIGVREAEIGPNHCEIKRMYECMNVISLTTNFDNLLKKAFDNSEKNFYPILNDSEFDNYFLSAEDDNSFIEIQSRGDVFWMECTGNKNKICPNKHKQCYVPGEKVVIERSKAICEMCKSEAKIYFAFPGTKEKDQEMSIVINGIWKYFANTISSVIVTGNSMNYDPVLIEFLRELIAKRDIPVMYISRFKEGESKKDYSSIFEKEATKFLFSNKNTKNIWARSQNTEEILQDLIYSFDKKITKIECQKFSSDEFNDIKAYFEQIIKNLFKNMDNCDEIRLALVGNVYNIPRDIFNMEQVTEMKYFSQLGLKTYWLRGQDDAYKAHNRLKHSLGVMVISSYLYLKIQENRSIREGKRPDINRNELYFLQLAALFHDLGHLPFSHLLEEVFEEFGWTFAGESQTFNHEQNTKNVISKMEVQSEVFRELLKEIGYNVEDIKQLINGEFGIGYLDALINSPIDCDKIEYLFSDAIFMNRGTKEDFKLFINEYVRGLSSNFNDFMVIENDSTRSFMELIQMRSNMYDQVYLRKGLRYLEACCKLIIRTFISYTCTEKEIFTAVEDKEQFEEYYNLSDSKIKHIIDFMEGCLKNIPKNQVCELYVLEQMVEAINGNEIISKIMKETVNNCFSLIKNTKNEEKVRLIEKDKIETIDITGKTINKKVLKQLLKDVYLRFPGVILIDYVEGKSLLSFGKREMRRRRSDGTTSATENILICDTNKGKQNGNSFKCLGDFKNYFNSNEHNEIHKYIHIYRITENLFYYMQAEDFVIYELRKAGIVDEN